MSWIEIRYVIVDMENIKFLATLGAYEWSFKKDHKTHSPMHIEAKTLYLGYDVVTFVAVRIFQWNLT